MHDDVGVPEIDGAGLHDERVLGFSRLIEIVEVDAFNAEFPQSRISSVTIELDDGTVYESGPTEAAGDPETPFTDEQVDEKFPATGRPVLGDDRAHTLMQVVHDFGDGASLDKLGECIYPTGVVT